MSRSLLPVDRDVLIAWIPCAIVAIVALLLGWSWLAILALIVMALAAGFFRDPRRRVPREYGVIVSPADGVVRAIEANHDPEAGPVPGHRIIIFLSVLNCHINRAPCAGIVRRIRYQPGKFLNALDARSSEENESNWIFMETARGPVTVRQITGLIARRIVCRVGEGEKLARGQRIGLIRFGSRTELYVPANAEVLIQVGAKVRGAQTIVARWKSEE